MPVTPAQQLERMRLWLQYQSMAKDLWRESIRADPGTYGTKPEDTEFTATTADDLERQIRRKIAADEERKHED